MKLIKSGKDCEVYDNGNTIIKKYKFIRHSILDPSWLLYYDDFNSKYNILPEIYEMNIKDGIHTCVMEKIEGSLLQELVLQAMSKQNQEYSEVMHYIKKCHDLIGNFLEYNIELSKQGKIMFHEDLNLTNIIVTESGDFKAIDIDSVRLNPIRKFSSISLYGTLITQFHNHCIHLE
jgi:hypothetical protein